MLPETSELVELEPAEDFHQAKLHTLNESTNTALQYMYINIYAQ